MTQDNREGKYEDHKKAALRRSYWQLAAGN